MHGQMEKGVQYTLVNDLKLKKKEISTIRSNLSHSYTHRGVLVNKEHGLGLYGKTSDNKFVYTK